MQHPWLFGLLTHGVHEGKSAKNSTCMELDTVYSKTTNMKIQDVSVSGLSVSAAVGVVRQVLLFKIGTYSCSFKVLIRVHCFILKWSREDLFFYVTFWNTLLGSRRTGFHLVAEVQTLRVCSLTEDSFNHEARGKYMWESLCPVAENCPLFSSRVSKRACTHDPVTHWAGHTVIRKTSQVYVPAPRAVCQSN